MTGTSNTLFSPHGTATRGMMATILWRMEGSPAPRGNHGFTDVEAGFWYADAVAWTVEAGIFKGYSAREFRPEEPISREQLAAIFHRYAQYKNGDTAASGSLEGFRDAGKVSDYAVPAIRWAVGRGLVRGKSGDLLDPQGTAARAEIAATLRRFVGR